MRKRTWFRCTCLALAILTGCGGEKHIPQSADAGLSETVMTEEVQTETEQELNTRSTEIVARQAMAEPSKSVRVIQGILKLGDKSFAAEAAEKLDLDALMEHEDEQERELTEKELKKLQWSIRSSDNGFFACTYYRPEEIDWQQVFYVGAGINVGLSDDQVTTIRDRLRAQRLEEERIKAELNGEPPLDETEQETEQAPYTEEELALKAENITALTLRSVQSFVKSRTGLEYSEARKPLRWPELSKNLFYFVRGDYSGIRVEFMSGKVCGNTYEITYRRAVYSKNKKPEYVMKVEIEKGKWKFIANLPIDEAQPKTLADIEFYDAKEIARTLDAKAAFEPQLPVEDDEYYEELEDSKKKDPVFYWAMITAKEDNSRITIDRVYLGDEICKELSQTHTYVPGENLETITLNAGEKIAVKVCLDDEPKFCVRISSGQYFGDYVFGSENDLKRFTKEGMPLPTYAAGRDVSGERRGTEFTDEKELLRFLEGTWAFYDSEAGEYTATMTIDGNGNTRIHTIAQDYLLEISGFDRIYADVRSDPPDVIKLKSTDPETLDIFTKYYPFLKRKVGDYRIKAIQKDGEQLLILSFENNGKDGLTYLLPGADALADEIVFYRVIGTNGWEE